MNKTTYLLSSPENARRLRESIEALKEAKGVVRDRIEEAAGPRLCAHGVQARVRDGTKRFAPRDRHGRLTENKAGAS